MTEESKSKMSLAKKGKPNLKLKGFKYSEGSKNIGEAAKDIDMSLVSDIQKYMQLAEYIERRCGESVGITKQIS